MTCISSAFCWLLSSSSGWKYAIEQQNKNLNFLFIYWQTFWQKVINCPAIANAWTLGAISQSPLSAGFDKIHYPGLTIIRRLFFVRQFLLDKFLKALSNDRKNILWIRVRQEFWISRQTKNQHFYFIGQENRFHFSCETHFFDRNFFTIWEIISNAEKDEENFFAFLFFVFIRQSDCFSVDTNF